MIIIVLLNILIAIMADIFVESHGNMEYELTK